MSPLTAGALRISTTPVGSLGGVVVVSALAAVGGGPGWKQEWPWPIAAVEE